MVQDTAHYEREDLMRKIHHSTRGLREAQSKRSYWAERHERCVTKINHLRNVQADWRGRPDSPRK